MTTSELNKKFAELEYKLRHIVVTRCDSMPTTNVGKIVIYNSEIFFWNGINYEKILTEDDPAASSTTIHTVAGYSLLPDPTLNTGEFYWVENDEGTRWLPGSLGGTYYKKGLYYSTGVSWETAPIPYQATQIEVNAGVEQYKFVTPNTLSNTNLFIKTVPNFVFVSSLSDLPTPVLSVITLQDDVTYFIAENIDLVGNRLVGGANTTIIGGSSENAVLTSTGLGVGVPLLTSIYTTPIRHIAFANVDTAFSFDGSTNPGDMALDWTGVNFLNVPNIGLVKDASNFIFDKGAFLNSKGLKFDGAIDTVGFGNCLFSGDGLLGNIIELLTTFTINRRFRIIYSSMVAFGLTTGIKVDAATTIGIERFILDTVNFSGGGTYLSGINYPDEKALFVGCVGIINTTAIGNLYMKNNAVPTIISVIGDRYAMSGVTASNGNNQKFTQVLANNSMRYDSTITRLFRVLVTFTIESGNNNICGLYVGVKRGALINPTADRISESEVYITTSGTKPDVGAVQALVELNQNDEVYLIVQNTTATSSITIKFMNMIIERTN